MTSLRSLLKGTPESNSTARGNAADGRPSEASTAQGAPKTEGAQRRGRPKDHDEPAKRAEEKPPVRFKLFGVGRKCNGKRVVVLRCYVAPAKSEDKWQATKVRAMIDSGAEGDRKSVV